MPANRVLTTFTMLCCFFVQHSFSQPVIQSFSPVTAKPGDQVIITGTQFSSTAASNTVYAGGVKATVVSASITSLTIKIPVGAGYGPLSVTVNGLTGYSAASFMPVFSGGEPMDNNSFAPDQNIETGSYPRQSALADLDLDGKPDMVVLQYLPGNVQPNYIQTYHNSSTSAAIGFTQQNSFPAGIFATDMVTADFDGDGKIDVATSSIGVDEISLLRNTSTSGQINFAARIIYSAGATVYHMAAADIDGDGKPDIAVTNYLAGTVTILRNQSTVGNISFTALPAFNAGTTPGMLIFTDLNGDRKPDMVIANELAKRFSVFQNTSTAGNFLFGAAAVTLVPDNLQVKNLLAADLDKDGKNDLLVTTSDDPLTFGNGWLYRNTSTGDGSISISNVGKLPNDGIYNPFFTPSAADVNGDGSPDIVVGWAGGIMAIAVYQNQSVPGSFVFSIKATPYSPSANQISIGDLNADGKPELVSSNFTNSYVSIIKNKIGVPSITGISPRDGGEGTVVTITGKGFFGATAVSFGGVAAASFTVVSTTEIKATVGTGATGEVRITGPAGTDAGFTFTYDNKPIIDSFAPLRASPGDTVTISGINLRNTSYVKFGGVPAAWFSVINATTIKAIPSAAGATGNISIATPAGPFVGYGTFVFLHKPVITDFNPKVAVAGQYVAIVGQYLATPGYAPNITLGGVPVDYVSDNGNQTVMLVVVGQGASGQVRVSHFGGADSMPGFTFIPAPVISSFLPLSAFPADTVTIRGKTFTGASAVFFGDSAAASFTVINDSIIKAVVGHGKSGVIKVVGPSGEATMASFVFMPLPAPVIQSFAPLKAIAGTTITLQGKNLWGVQAVKIGNTPVKLFYQITPSVLELVVPIGAAGAITVTTYYGTYTLAQPVFERIAAPVITAVSPLNGKPGDQVTITGSGFGNDKNGVVVYFGQVTAAVNAAQDNAITVTIPKSAVYAPVTVTVNHLTASSPKRFNPTNPAIANNYLGANSFKQMTDSTYGGGSETNMIGMDFNQDGRPDFLTVDYRGSINFYLNQSSPGKPYWILVNSIIIYKFVQRIEVADIDGNGKKDLIFFSNSGPTLSFALNNSTKDSVSFVYDETVLPSDGLVADVNNDGKADVVSLDRNTFQPIILLNNSTVGKIAFRDTLINSQTPLNSWGLTVAEDFDNDGLIDLAGVQDSEHALVFRNTGSKTAPSFNAPPVLLTGNYVTSKMFAADLNGDGKSDLLVAESDYNTASFEIFKNLSTPGVIKFSTKQVTGNIAIGRDFNVADINGDNKLDIVAGANPFLYAYQNNSTADSIILGDKLSYLVSGGAVLIADVDGDGKIDVLSSSDKTSCLLNQVGMAHSTTLCPNSNITLDAAVPGTSFQWQMNSGSGFVNITNDARFAGATTASLTITNTPSDWLKRQFRCRVNNVSFSDPYELIFSNAWQSYASTDWHTASNWGCGSVPDGNTAAILPPGYTIELTADAICQSLVSSFSTFTIKPGVQLVITNK